MAFRHVAAQPDARVEDLALALAGAFRPVDAEGALARLDALAAEVRDALPPAPRPLDEVQALGDVLARRHDYAGDTETYDDPVNSWLDVVLERRRGLPITLSVLYVAVAHRAGIALAGFGLPGHFVAGHVATDPPLLVDPFRRGTPVAPPGPVAPWTAHATALRMLNNLVAAFERRSDLANAILAAELRLLLPAPRPERAGLEVELRALRARLN